MTFLHSVVSVPMGYIVAAIAVVAALLVIWIATLLSRRMYVTLKRSEETELLTIYLSRIAASLERLAAAQEPRIVPIEPREVHEVHDVRGESVPEPVAARPMRMSMFGL